MEHLFQFNQKAKMKQLALSNEPTEKKTRINPFDPSTRVFRNLEVFESVKAELAKAMELVLMDNIKNKFANQIRPQKDALASLRKAKNLPDLQCVAATLKEIMAAMGESRVTKRVERHFRRYKRLVEKMIDAELGRGAKSVPE